MQNQGQVVEAHDLMKPASQIVKQSRQIAVRDDRFGNRKQCLVAVTRSSCVSINVRESHREEPWSVTYLQPPNASSATELMA